LPRPTRTYARAYNRVAGNEDGPHHVISEVFGDTGFTIAGQAWT